MSIPADLRIGDRTVGPGAPVYMIAEISANHDQSFDHAVKLIRAAAEAGADAVKLQTYTPDSLTLNSAQPCFLIGEGTAWEGRRLHDLYSEASMPWEWQPELKRIANGLGLTLFSTPYDSTAVDFLETLDVPAYKIASFEIVDLPLIRRVAQTGKPIIISTGMATMDEIEEALNAATSSGAAGVVLLKCNSAYPAPVSEMNLRTIPHMMHQFGVPVGLSDHTLDLAIPIAAVALGACVIEKHITLSRDVPGPDKAFSLTPEEFAATVKGVRMAEQALGAVSYGATAREQPSRKFRRSLFVTAHLRSGDCITAENVRSIRPADGISPKYYEAILGRKVVRDVEPGTPLSWDMLAGPQPA